MLKEELEVLHSIYEGDDNFKEINSTSFQYKYGEDGNHRSFIVEISWTDTYPDDGPQINLNTFYNKHILDAVKETIKGGISSQIPDLLGCAMTYTLFEWVKENLEELLEQQPLTPVIAYQSEDKETVSDEKDRGLPNGDSKKKEKKEQLSKNQKRKLYDRLNAAGERPRGWNWVDVIRHLSQTGSAK
ncbi:hypothetical protein FSP39_000755 [Pinctada imbricata]|uniref:RWD domain-containing protein n=1 Tax=Pinctada imbricata TaxID=66713 RepID=A0AA89BLB9_PINIB|nr:hypothetical protein FSP39_000755 [Pinctada imbricata]